MAISSEIAKTVQEKNILRIRIMLKDSLLVDKSFSKYKELLDYAVKNGVDVWMTQEEPLENAEKPWTLDLMNYELTALVNDFTRAHVQYVQKIITEVYKGDSALGNRESSQSLGAESRKPTSLKPPASDSRKNKSSGYNTIREETKKIQRIINNIIEKKRWHFDDIRKINNSAKEIEIACENMLKEEITWH